MLAHPAHSSLFPYSEVEQQIEKWDFVIKVKHGNTLRRLGANVHGKLMDYTMNKLKNKIISLFKFSDDAVLILTYTDIDGDIVTLDTDDELRDAVIGQRLNPIRITVQLKSKRDTLSSVGSLQSETSSEVPKSNSISDFQKSNFMDMFNVVDKDLLNSYASEKLNFKSEVKKAATCFPPVHKLVGQLSQVRLSKSNQTEPVRESTSTKPSVVPAHPMNRNIAYESKWADFPTNENVDSVTKQNDSIQTVDAPGSLNPLEELHDSFSATNKAANSAMLFGFPKHIPPVSSNSSYTPAEGGNKSTSNEIRNFSYLPIIRPPQPPYFQRFHLNDLDKPNTIQKDVQCNVCGTHPIVGPKFMSNINGDHHLCNVCYTQIGNEAEYTEFDCATHRAPRLVQHGYHNEYSSHQFPSLHSSDLVRQQRIKFDSLFIKGMTVLDGTVLPPSTPFTKVWRMRNNGTASWPYGTQLVWVGGDQLGHRSSFVLEFPGNEVPVDKELDVTVDFSTPSRPGRYVSYWRLQSPSLRMFGQRVWALFEVKDNKHHPNTTATTAASFQSNFNLNLPPINNTQNASQSTDLNTKPTFGIDINADPFDSTEATESTFVNFVQEPYIPSGVFVQQPYIPSGHFVEQPSFQFVKVPSITSVTNASEAVKDNNEFSWFRKSVDITSTPNEESVKYTSVDPTLVADALADVNDCKNIYDENSVEQTCLNELREMGFKQIELNKEVLRRNKYDLKLTVEDLCGFADWDPLLTELHNMEFYDRELNKKMLVKNGGSIKRTVLDLLVAKKD